MNDCGSRCSISAVECLHRDVTMGRYNEACCCQSRYCSGRCAAASYGVSAAEAHVRPAPEAMSRIEFSLFIAAPPARCFDLARSIELHLDSTGATSERAIAGRTSGLLELGESVTWQARHFGVRQKLTSRISIADRPNHFRDSKVRGAFASFDHDHYFTRDRDGTIMRDVFDYRAPFGPLGILVERLVLTKYMQRFLVARAHVVKRVAESEEWRNYLAHAD